MLIRYCTFKEGVSKLKQVTGHNHCSMQWYIVGIITGGVPPQFLAAIQALMDFWYLAQMHFFNEHGLQQLDTALQSFHTHKGSIIATGGCSKHFHIPKLELLQHVVPSIQDLGAIMQWSTDITEHAHVTEVKNPTHVGNVTRVDRLTPRSMILTLREVLTKRHCILKERLRLWTRDEWTKSQSDGLQICKTDAVIA